MDIKYKEQPTKNKVRFYQMYFIPRKKIIEPAPNSTSELILWSTHSQLCRMADHRSYAYRMDWQKNKIISANKKVFV